MVIHTLELDNMRFNRLAAGIDTVAGLEKTGPDPLLLIRENHQIRIGDIIGINEEKYVDPLTCHRYKALTGRSMLVKVIKKINGDQWSILNLSLMQVQVLLTDGSLDKGGN